MKLKVTKKSIVENYYNIIEVGYCNLHHLLYYIEPNYYTCGVYGWNSDIYEINKNTCIVTGYRPFGNIYAGYYDICKKYDDKARNIIKSNFKYKTKKRKINKLLENFINESLELKK